MAGRPRVQVVAEPDEEAEANEIDGASELGSDVLEATDPDSELEHEPELDDDEEPPAPVEATDPYRFTKFSLDRRLKKIDEMLEKTEEDLFSVESVVEGLEAAIAVLQAAGADEDDEDDAAQHSRYIEYQNRYNELIKWRDQYNSLRAQAESLKRRRDRHIRALNPPSEGIKNDPPAKRSRRRR